MNGFEAGQTFYSYQGQAPEAEHDDEGTMSKVDALVKFIKFIREWKNDNKFFYR